ncbi:hypothetical protein DPEC_G00139740 [Dallia pectoralis]|uniref:Uncharacterized protein n=1 Tax=Dallia pectoralis TaxID=75939 RepID=A0ACC2GM91_DALPE|nr:hypothetical protein DPEC_G00139740 [Dallia pectoralis]
MVTGDVTSDPSCPPVSCSPVGTLEDPSLLEHREEERSFGWFSGCSHPPPHVISSLGQPSLSPNPHAMKTIRTP